MIRSSQVTQRETNRRWPSDNTQVAFSSRKHQELPFVSSLSFSNGSTALTSPLLVTFSNTLSFLTFCWDALQPNWDCQFVEYDMHLLGKNWYRFAVFILIFDFVINDFSITDWTRALIPAVNFYVSLNDDPYHPCCHPSFCFYFGYCLCPNS